ncbi:MAG: nuclear transport factor 2 family protein [Chitinophagaceae bacterium]|nr:MAG: nuclear transport factor 2 family protein [Chitinophagaceae bacterium]
MKFAQLLSISFYFFPLLGLNGCGSQNNDAQMEARKLFELERKAIDREFQNDTTYLSSIMDATFIELSKGAVKNKHDVLKTIYLDNVSRKQNGIVRDSFLLKDSIIHLYGNSAVVTFIMQTFNKKGDSSFTKRTRFYDVWVKRDDAWKAVTWQGTPVPND